jgi:hypothetical protein
MLRRSFLLGWGALAVPANAHSFDRRELELLNDGESNLCPICDLMVVSERQARGVLHFTPKRTWDWRLRVDAASGGFHVLAPEGGAAKVEAIWTDGQHRSKSRALLFVLFAPCGLKPGMQTILVADNHPASRMWIDARGGLNAGDPT